MVQRNSTKTNGGDSKKKASFLLKYLEPPDPELAKLSFMERWARVRKMRREDGSGTFMPQTLMRGLMCFQAPTQLYMFLWYIIPYFISDYGPWVVYYFNVLACFVLINGLANWFMVILYDPSFAKTKDNPYVDVRSYEDAPDHFVPLCEQARSNQNGTNGHCVYDMTSKEALPWNYCDKCEMYIPPRAHHCTFCKKCILKRDHHCFMVGNCIGFKNQRYFIVLAFYAMITGIVGGLFTYKYIQQVVWPELDSWGELFFPVAIWKSLYGNIKGAHALLLVHLPLEILFGLIGFVYFTSQMTIAAEGKTLFEVTKQLPIKNMNTRNRNLKSVFGDFWGLNFLFPMTLIFRQRDDGVHWDNVKLDYNANNNKPEHNGKDI